MALRTPLTAQPHLYIGDSTGRPLDYGRVYFGEPNKDPEFYPIDIYLDPEMTIAAAQPVRTKGGFMDVGGNLAELHAAEVVYSLKVLDQYGRQVFYKPEMYRNNVSDFLTDEIIRATAAETLIAGNLTAETQRAIAAEKVIADAVVTEKDRAIAAEGALDSKYATLDNTVAGIVNGRPTTAFATKALMTASALIDGDYAIVTDDTINNGLYVKTGGSWVKSDYDPVEAAKTYADSNPLFKPKKIVEGDDFNGLYKTGIYYHWGTPLSKSQVANAPYYSSTDDMVFGVLEVISATTNLSYSLYQTFYPYVDSFPIVSRKYKQTGEFSEWTPVIDSKTIHDLKVLEDGQDVLLLDEGSYTIPSVASGRTMVNLPDVLYPYGRIDVKGVTGRTSSGVFKYKEITFTPYGRHTAKYINKNSELGWTGWLEFADKASLLTTKDMADAFTNSKTISYGKDYTDEVIAGTHTYPAYYAGYNGITGDNGALFDTVIANLSNSGVGATEYRIYTDNLYPSGPSYRVSAEESLNPKYQGICLDFPTTNLGEPQAIRLDKVIILPKNTPFVIVFRKTELNRFNMGYLTTNEIGENSFNMVVTPTEWGEKQIATASTINGYYQAGFKLLLSGSSEDANPNPVEDKYTPEIVLPPKVYCLAGLQAHIYPEHLTPEPHDLYLHDITCSRGKQTVRGWQYDVPTGTTASTSALTWSLHDKQTGNAIASASTSVVTVDPTRAGNKNVMVIGDSYVNAGTITQRLLDISATDPLKVSLLGTRGTGDNKHEGRGGWKVSDYATIGRIYQTFTVSGVTVPPAINSADYTFNGGTFTVQETDIVDGAGTITCYATGTTPTGAGILTKSNGSAGDDTIAFSSVAPESGNPFWIDEAIDFSKYLTSNGFALPDVVLIQLGVNDSFNRTTDANVKTLTDEVFPNLDALIASIKASNPSVKIAVVAPNTYASQDAFGFSYGASQTAWRAKRNIVLWNKDLYAYYKDKEDQNIFVVGAGVNVDTLANFGTTNVETNSHNSDIITVQNNGVHPSTSGYKQIGDAMFAWIKAVS